MHQVPNDIPLNLSKDLGHILTILVSCCVVSTNILGPLFLFLPGVVAPTWPHIFKRRCVCFGLGVLSVVKVL